MERVIVSVHYPRGKVPARGWKCPTCGEEVLLPEDASEARALAHAAGLLGVEGTDRRKLQRTGNSITVSLNPDWVRNVLHAAPGSYVRVARQGNRILIEADAGA